MKKKNKMSIGAIIILLIALIFIFNHKPMAILPERGSATCDSNYQSCELSGSASGGNAYCDNARAVVNLGSLDMSKVLSLTPTSGSVIMTASGCSDSQSFSYKDITISAYDVNSNEITVNMPCGRQMCTSDMNHIYTFSYDIILGSQTTTTTTIPCVNCGGKNDSLIVLILLGGLAFILIKGKKWLK